MIVGDMELQGVVVLYRPATVADADHPPVELLEGPAGSSRTSQDLRRAVVRVEIAILRYRLYDTDRRAPMLAAGGDGSQAPGVVSPSQVANGVGGKPRRRRGSRHGGEAQRSSGAGPHQPVRWAGTRTAALTLVLGLPRMSRPLSRWWRRTPGEAACQRGDGSDH